MHSGKEGGLLSAESVFISGAANTVSRGAVWLSGSDPLLLFGLSNLIAVVDIQSQNVVCTLQGHSARITTITELENCDSYQKIVSSGVDGRIIVWIRDCRHHLTEWKILAELDMPVKNNAITAHASLSTSIGDLIVASDIQGNVVSWFSEEPSSCNGNFLLKEVISMQPAHMPQDLSLMELPSSSVQNADAPKSVLLAIGSVDAKIHLRAYAVESTSISNKFLYSQESVLVGSLSGHDDWVRCLSGPAYTTENDPKNGVSVNALYLASGSHDSKIRIWRIAATGSSSSTSKISSSDVPDDDDDEDIDEETSNLNEGKEVGRRAYQNESEELGEARCSFNCSEGSSSALFFVTLDALLVGHEDWVSSVHWIDDKKVQSVDQESEKDPSDSSQSFHLGNNDKRLKLFSTSMDRNMVIWSAEENSGIWIPVTRMGDIGGTLGGSVGGNLLGFVGSCLDVRSHSVLGIGYGGSFHLWQWRKSTEKALAEDDSAYAWQPVPFITGHFAPVRDVVWGYGSSPPFLISVSADQTCRLFSPLSKAMEGQRKWCEVSRPQIHGYDLSCVQLAPLQFSPFVIYSGGDEKAIRVFEAPLIVAEGLSRLSDNSLAEEYMNHSRDSNADQSKDVSGVGTGEKVHRAYIPELGLSNKSSNLMSEEEASEQASRGVDSTLWKAPPLEGQLSDFTLWPEEKKLFGHVGDVVCLSASRCGEWIASAGKGRDQASSGIRLWETNRMICVSILEGHDSTITSLRFSSDSRFLVSGGKDRALCLHRLNRNHHSSNTPPFVPFAFLAKAHKRIIWDIAWLSTDDGLCAFVSASRDGTIKMWNVACANSDDISAKGDLQHLGSFSPFGDKAVTALDVTKIGALGSYGSGWLLAIGAETGGMQIRFISESVLSSPGPLKDDLCPLLHSFSSKYSHGATVKRLRWTGLNFEGSTMQLASCGDDNTVRIFNITI